MKNRMLILMICLLSSLSSFAQTPNWAWWDDYDGEVISSLIQDQYVYVVGNFHDSVLQIGSSNLTPKGSLDIYLAKWDTNGNFVWAVTISDSGFQWSTNLHLNANNELVVGGNNMNSNLILGNDTIYNQGLNNQVGFIVKFDTSGNLLDAFQSEVVIDMCVDSSNAVYVTTGTKILKYSPAGILIWQEPFQAKYISYSESGSCLLVSAEFYNTLTIGSYSITAVSSQTYGPTSDICCYKIDLNGNPNWLINVTGTIRGELLLRPYLNKQTNELFLAYDRLGLSGSYVNIGKVDLSGMLSILPIGNTVPNLSIPLDFLDNPWIEIATGKDSFVVFYLISNMSSKVYFFNVMTQLTSSSLDIQPEQILYDGPNSIYMGGTTPNAQHSFGKLGAKLSSLSSFRTFHNCAGATRTLVSNIVGGVPPLTYSWSPSVGLNTTSNDTVLCMVNSNTSYILTVTDAVGQIQKDTINIIVDTLLTSFDTVVVCSNQAPYSWNSQTLSNTGVYIDTFVSIQGCDSIVTLNLTIIPTSTSTNSVSLCSNQVPYQWNSQSLSISGTYTSSFTNAQGCDSIATLNLTIIPTSASTDSVSLCSNQVPYQWNSQSLSTSGIYTSTFTNVQGCDSIATLSLTIIPTSASTASVSLCSNQAPYQWNSQSLSISGTYTSSFTNAQGCDSIATLNLTIHSLPVVQILPSHDTSICANSSIVLYADSNLVGYNWIFNGNPLTPNDSIVINSTGNYVLTCYDNYGCYATDSIQITVQPAPQPQIVWINYLLTCSNVSGVNYQWFLNGNPIGTNDSSLAISQNGEYSVLTIDTLGCFGVDTINVVALQAFGTILSDEILVYPNPTNATLFVDFNVEKWGVYDITLANILGEEILSKKIFVDAKKLTTPISMSGLSNGIYFLTINNGKEKVIRKVIKE